MGLFIYFRMDKFLTPSPKGNFLDKFQQSAQKARTMLTPKRIFEEVQEDFDTSDVEILSDTETTGPDRKKKKPNPSRAKSGMNLISVYLFKCNNVKCAVYSQFRKFIGMHSNKLKNTFIFFSFVYFRFYCISDLLQSRVDSEVAFHHPRVEFSLLHLQHL